MLTFDAMAGWLFVAVGAGLLTASTLAVVSAVLSRNWPQTRGVVTASRLKIEDHDGPTYHANLEYEYEVMGKSYVGRRCRYGDRWSVSWPGPSKATVARYPIGTRVMVHYNPEDPTESVLEPGVSGLLVIGCATSAFFLLLGIMAVRSATG